MPTGNQNLNTRTIEVDEISSNIKSSLIEVSEDKLLLILNNYSQNISKSKSWITYLSIGFTILISLLTSDFKNFAGIDAGAWKGLFIIGLIICLLCTIYSLFAHSRPSIDSVVTEIKGRKLNS
ncbi:hypothetical protein [Pantoea ananatis]|nr:hypothetical protein [Pantoea ananatis]